MKIAVVIDRLNIRGGTHKQVLRLCEYLQKQGVDFTLYTKRYDSTKTYKEFSKFEIVSLNDCSMKNENAALYNMISKDIDIINIHDNGLNGLIRYAIRDKKKIVWQINDLPSPFQVGVDVGKGRNLKNFIRRIVIKMMARKIDIITVNVSKNRDRVRNKMGRDARVLYCGVDINNNLEKHDYSRINLNRIRLLSVGVFLPYRNYETLIEVVSKLRQDNIPIELDIIGSLESDKQYVNNIKRIIDKKEMAECIHIWGQVDETTYNNLFNEADLFAFINIDQSWGLAVFEAMSTGLPTLVSNSVGAIELLHDGRDCIIVDPKDVDEICCIIKKLISNPEYYNRISDEAESAVKNMTWDNLYSSKMLSIFNELEDKK